MLPAKPGYIENDCWTYVLDDDDWINEGYKSKEEARNAAIQDAHKTAVGKITVSVGYRRAYDPCKNGHAYELIKLLQQDAITELDGLDTGWLDDVTGRALDDLDIAIRKALLDWFNEHKNYDPRNPESGFKVFLVTDEETFELFDKGGEPID